MKILRSFSKSEDAYLLASFLGSEGIECSVVDDNAFGGNLLGATKSSIRIEVPDEDFDRAKKILEEHEKAVVLEEANQKLPVESQKRNRIFDILVICEALIFTAFSLVPNLGILMSPSPEMEEFLIGQVYSEDLWTVVWTIWPGYAVLCIVSSVLLLLRLGIGRYLFAGTLVWGLVATLGVPPAISTPFGSFLESFLNYLGGAIVAMSFLPPVNKEFRSRVSS